MSRIAVIGLCVVISLHSAAQNVPAKTVTSREQIWVAYMSQARITDHFGAWLDIQYRQTGDFVDRPFQFLFRPAATWFVKDNLRVNVGYAFVNHFPAEGKETSQPEHRTWQQLWYNRAAPHVTTLQWLRFEQRFMRKIENDALVEGYNRGNRIRYNLGLFFPLKGEKITAGVPFVSTSDELFINFGKDVVYNTFDQNRFFVGLGYAVTNHLNVQAGYLNVYQQHSSGHQHTISHVIRAAVFHNLDLRTE